VTYEPNKNRQ